MATPLPLQRDAASTTLATGAWLADTDTERYEKVQRRVIGQLLQTLLYEAALPYRCKPLGEHQHRFTVPLGDGVEYRCNGLLSTSFELIRLDHASLERVDSTGQRSTPDLHLALTELLATFKDSPHLARFIQEIEQTQLKDLQARHQGYQPARPAHELDVDALEQHFMDAHSYHPCYKSRIGFS
ncbi:IucA/IucC family siderophore biosynthesis protein, partial [Pseudomonas syringae]|nr:IucA/IucC family siderophore biosynthesis protein [Pseudomonas syringae]